MSRDTQYGTVGTKGQVTVPMAIRTRLGLRDGDRLEFVVEGDRTYIRPLRSAANPFEPYAGALDSFPGGEAELKAWIDDLRSDQEADR